MQTLSLSTLTINRRSANVRPINHGLASLPLFIIDTREELTRVARHYAGGCINGLGLEEERKGCHGHRQDDRSIPKSVALEAFVEATRTTVIQWSLGGDIRNMHPLENS
jgi:hypothetical protein